MDTLGKEFGDIPNSGWSWGDLVADGLSIYFDFVAAPTEDCPQAYTAYCVKVNGFNYSDIVAGIVKDRYPYDKMEAVLMNYLNTDSEKREQYISEYNEMQEWRAKAKEIAKQVSF